MIHAPIYPQFTVHVADRAQERSMRFAQAVLDAVSLEAPSVLLFCWQSLVLPLQGGCQQDEYDFNQAGSRLPLSAVMGITVLEQSPCLIQEGETQHNVSPSWTLSIRW